MPPGENPAKGTLDLSGGFIDMNETGEEGVSREVKEETGLIVTEAKYLFHFQTLTSTQAFSPYTRLVFSCKVEDDTQLKAMDDVAESFWVPLSQINPEEFGLDSVRKGVKYFLKIST